MGGTDVYYNGCILHNVQTRQWEQEIVYDESGTDVLGCRYHLAFEGTIHGQSAGLVANGGPPYANYTSGFPGASAVATYQVLHHSLSQARRDLLITFDGQTVLAVNEQSDTDNGPKPKHVRLTQITSDMVFRVEFSIDVCVVPCLGKRPGPVLNNRWSIAEELDENYHVTRTITGRIRLPNSRIPASAYKSVVIPSGELGFKRQRINYEVLPNGLEANYSIVDRQIYEAAPFPATKMEVRHAEVATNNYGAFGAELHVRLTAPPNASRVALIQLVYIIAEAKIKLRARRENLTGFPDLVSIIEYHGEENVVEGVFRVTYHGLGPSEYLSGLKIDIGNFPTELRAKTNGQYDARRPYLPPTYGYNSLGGNDSQRDPAVLFLLHCYLQEPCSGGHAIAQVGPGKKTAKPEQVDTKGVAVSGVTSQRLQQSPGDFFSRDTKLAPYTYARISSTYTNSPNRAVLPDAGWNGETGADTVHIAMLAGPCSYRIIKADFERAGKPPELPVPEDTYKDGGLTGTLMDFHTEVMPPTTSAAGQSLIYRAIAYYVYALNRPPSLQHKIRAGVLPFTSVADRFDPALIFRTKV